MIIISLLLLVTYVLYIWIKLQPYNQAPLKIKTFDGSDSPYHPTVLYFKDSWNGYKYWLAETPFSPKCKPYEDRNECPSIHVSNDGINWYEITSNPIDDLNKKEVENLDYFSDPHLIYLNGTIECWYRFTHRNGVKDNYNNLQLVRKKSSDGIKWGEREVLVELSATEGNNLGNMVVSPAILYNKGKYRMWYVNSESRIKRGLSYSESIDGKHWLTSKAVVLEGKKNKPWHIDVNYIDNTYYLLSYDLKDLTLWKSHNGITFKYVKVLLSPSVDGSFYSYQLYRSCIIKDEKYKIYFSAHDSFKTYIGLMEGENPEDCKIITTDKHSSIIGLIKFIIKYKIRTIKFILRRIYKKI